MAGSLVRLTGGWACGSRVAALLVPSPHRPEGHPDGVGETKPLEGFAGLASLPPGTQPSGRGSWAALEKALLKLG